MARIFCMESKVLYSFGSHINTRSSSFHYSCCDIRASQLFLIFAVTGYFTTEVEGENGGNFVGAKRTRLWSLLLLETADTPKNVNAFIPLSSTRVLSHLR